MVSGANRLILLGGMFAKRFFIIWACIMFMSIGASAQSAQELMRQGIAHYQIDEFEKSLSYFNQAVALDSTDLDIIGRRGYVCSRYIMAIELGRVNKPSQADYDEIVSKGILDLKSSLAKFPENDENQRSLRFLESKKP